MLSGGNVRAANDGNKVRAARVVWEPAVVLLTALRIVSAARTKPHETSATSARSSAHASYLANNRGRPSAA